MVKIFVGLLAMFTINIIISYLQKRDNTSNDITSGERRTVPAENTDRTGQCSRKDHGHYVGPPGSKV